jgi:hypothetical protein
MPPEKHPLHFIQAGTGRASAPPPTPTPAPPPQQQPPPSLAHVEQTWLDTLEAEAAKVHLESSFSPYHVATAAEIGVVVAEAQRMETWYASLLPVAEKLAAQGHGRLLARVNYYRTDMHATRGIYEKMQQDARASEAATTDYITKSHTETMAGYTEMHDKQQAAYDEANDKWEKGFNS